eukprot:201527_1
MALCKAVQFRLLAAQLTAPEQTQFLSELQDLNTNIITSALFHYIMHTSCTHHAHITDAEEMNDIMSNIILSRKVEQKLNVAVLEDSPIIKLDCIPRRLVGEIS